jgi:feruloyl-CoA synthase
MLFLSEPGCRAALGGGEGRSLANLSESPELRSMLRERIERYNGAHPSNSQRVGRAVVLLEPPSIDAGEITDKGYLNQGALLRRRARSVEDLYAGPGAPEVLVLAPPAPR